MPTYKLTYFPVRGKAELIRILFHYTGTPFEDIRVKGEEWQALKASGKPPMGLLPILEVDDTVLFSSNAIAGYIAEVTGLVADTPLDRARGEMLLDAMNDAVNPFFTKFFSEKDKTKKAEVVTELVEKTFPPWVAKVETLLKQNGGGDGWYIGSKVTYVDFAIFTFFDTMATLIQKDASVLLPSNKAPKLAALWQKVKELPKLAAYLKTRPSEEEYY